MNAEPDGPAAPAAQAATSRSGRKRPARWTARRARSPRPWPTAGPQPDDKGLDSNTWGSVVCTWFSWCCSCVGAGQQPDARPGGFGPNEWLVDEIYQQYLQDPNSVDRAWWDFFADYKPRRRRGRRQRRLRRRAPPADGRSRRAPRRPATRPPADRAGTRGGAPLAPTGARRREPGWPEQPAPPRPAPAEARRPARRQPAPTGPPPKPAADGGHDRSRARPPASSPTWRPASRSRPRPACARSRRSCSIDNRIVINNHLKRGRGGKVSFTHLIGYAMVAGARGDAGDERRLRRGRRQAGARQARARQPRPRHRPAEARRHAASCSCPSIKARRDAGLRRSSGRPTRTSSAGRATTSSPSTTSPAPRSA